MQEQLKKQKKIGKIIVPPGVFIDIHEKRTVDYLATHLGHDITFLAVDRRKNMKTPDIFMNRVKWEIKCPKGKGSRVIENILRSALKQSPYIILDLRRMDGRTPTQKWTKEIERRFDDAKSIKILLVITRQEDLLQFNRTSTK